MSDFGLLVNPVGLGKPYVLNENSTFVTRAAGGSVVGWTILNPEIDTGFRPDLTSYDIVVTSDGSWTDNRYGTFKRRHYINASGNVILTADNPYIGGFNWEIYVVPKLVPASGYGATFIGGSRYLHLNDSSMVSNVVTAGVFSINSYTPINSVVPNFNRSTDIIFACSQDTNVSVGTFYDSDGFYLQHRGVAGQYWYNPVQCWVVAVRRRVAYTLPPNSHGIAIYAKDGSVLLSASDSQISAGGFYTSVSAAPFSIPGVSMPLFVAGALGMVYSGTYHPSIQVGSSIVTPIFQSWPTYSPDGNTFISRTIPYLDGSMYL